MNFSEVKFDKRLLLILIDTTHQNGGVAALYKAQTLLCQLFLVLS